MPSQFVGVLNFLQLVLEDCLAHNYKTMSKDLLIKYDKDPNFKKEVDVNSERYEAILQAATYSDLSVIPQGILQHIKSRNIYFYFGYQQPLTRKLLPKLAMYLAKNFNPQPNEPYTFVFFNELCPDNYVLWNLREVFAGLKLEQVSAIQQFIVVKPYFYHKAMDWMTYGTVAKFLKSKTKFIYSYSELCKHLILSQEALLDYVPRGLYQNQCPQLYQRSLKSSPSLKGDSQHPKKSSINQKMAMLKNMVVKPGQEVNLIGDYEQSQIGVPVVLKMLLFSLQSNQEALKTEGLFRKSVSIDELEDNINELITKNYDYLMEIKNSHTIANLIKKFFSSLKVPVFPFEDFKRLMGIKDPEQIKLNLKDVVQGLPDVNKTTLMLLVTFLKEKILPNQENNKMGLQNLSICFAPCLFRSQAVSSVNELMYAGKAVGLTKFCIEDFDNIFGTKEEREDLFRKSYYDSKKNFEEEMDIGLEETLKKVEESHPGALNSRCSSRYSQKFPLEMEEEILVFSAPKKLNKEENFQSLLAEQESDKKQNPRFSRYQGLDDENKEQEILQVLETNNEEVKNPRYSRNVNSPDLRQKKSESDKKVEQQQPKIFSYIDDSD